MNKSAIKPILAIRLLLFFALFSCTHPPGVAIATASPVTACDTINVNYTRVIQPVFSANCYSCHSTAVTANGGLDLEDTVSLRFHLRIGYNGDNVYGSKLFHCLLHTKGMQQMPPTYIIDSCDLFKIHHWLNIGAPF